MRLSTTYLLLAGILCHEACAQRPNAPSTETATAEHREIKPLRIAFNNQACIQPADATPANRCAVVAPVERCAEFLQVALAAATEPSARIEQRKQLAMLALNTGLTGLAMSQFAHLVSDAVSRGDANAAYEFKYWLGVTRLRQGEVTNCLENHNDETCVLPLTEKARHHDERGSRAAIEAFESLLAERPNDLHVRWLLNLAYMTLGEHPGGVPERHRIAPQNFRSKTGFPKFANIAPALGIHANRLLGSVLTDDLDGDGNLDLLLSSADPCEPVLLYLNDGKGGFINRTSGSGFEQELAGSHMIQADYDNDGLLDVFVLRGLWEAPDDAGGDYGVPLYHSLMRNLGNGRFKNVTAEAGLLGEPNHGMASVWSDFNHDGWVDLFVCDTGRLPKLWLNQRGERFVRHTETGITTVATCSGAVAGDFDDDRDQDLFVSIFRGSSVLYLNRGDGTFDLSKTKFDRPLFGFPTWSFDYDNDGLMDLFISGYEVEAPEAVGRLMNGGPAGIEHVIAYKNHGGGKFKRVTMGLESAILVMGGNAGDLDNDGFEDLVLGTGGPRLDYLVPNRAYRNRAGKAFDDVTYAGGFGNLQKGHGIALGDLDNDGDQDVIAKMGGFFPTDKFSESLYENPGSGNSWLVLRLQGTKANRSAIGTRVTVSFINGEGQPTKIHRVVNSGGSFGSNSLQLEMGLGGAKKVDRLVIHWAGSKTASEYNDLPVNRFYRIVEGSPLTALDVPRFEMPSARSAHHHKH